MERLLDALTGKGSSEATRASFRQRFTDGSLDEAEVEIEVDEAPAMPFDIPGMGGQVYRPQVDDGQGDGQGAGQAPQAQGARAFQRLTEEEADKRVDPDDINRVALADAEANGIVFLDEIDKIAVSDVRGGSVSREGVQRDLLPLIEGHHRRDQIRAAQDRPHPVHRLGRVPHRQARRPAARASGPPADPRRIEGADPGGFRPDPVGDPRQPDRAISGPARDRRRDRRLRRRRHRGARPHRRRSERGGREYRRAAAPDGDGEAARGRQLRGRGSQRRVAGRRCGVRRTAAARASPRTPISAATCSNPRSFAGCRDPRTASPTGVHPSAARVVGLPVQIWEITHVLESLFSWLPQRSWRQPQPRRLRQPRQTQTHNDRNPAGDDANRSRLLQTTTTQTQPANPGPARRRPNRRPRQTQPPAAPGEPATTTTQDHDDRDESARASRLRPRPTSRSEPSL